MFEREKILDELISSKEKSMDTNIEKGGEGSRGGKIIGHTKSGKPIYQSSMMEILKTIIRMTIKMLVISIGI
jgi:hypothetical protein